MKLWELVLAIVGIICLLLGAIWIRRGELPKQEFTISDGGCNMPVTWIQPPAGVNPAGSAIFIHGLSANRRLMTYLGEDFAGHGFNSYLVDLPGHGDNTVPFNFLRAQQCASAAVESLIRSGRTEAKTTVLVGHSMGGAISIRVADRDPVAATIAISPGPSNLPQRMPANLLVFSASGDIAYLKSQAKKLKAAAGGDRTEAEDFAEARAFQLEHVRFSSHTSLIMDRRVAHEAELWAMRTLFPQVSSETLALNLDLATYETYKLGRRRLAGAFLGECGIFLLFPICATIVAKIAGLSRAESEERHPGFLLAILEFAFCSLVGVLILTLGVPLRFLHLYSADYLVSLLLIVGGIVIILNRKIAREIFALKSTQVFAAAALGFATFLGLGAWLNWQITDAWLTAPRWLRFAGVLPIVWIYMYAEEVMLGPVQSGKGRALRFGKFLILRLELWLACAVGVYFLGSSQILLVILFTFLLLFSVLQRLAADALRLRGAHSTAAALFSAILAAWFVAAVFPLT